MKNWKLQQEISRLQLELDNLERGVVTKIKHMRKRLERIREYTKETKPNEIFKTKQP